MITRIVNGICYSPEPLGQTNLLVAGRQIAALGTQAELSGDIVQTVDASDCYVVPGLVDSLAHIIGGGGEGGFRSRTSELKVTDAIEAGVTTLVGVLGTDAVTRTLTNLLAKAHALDEEGLTCYCHTGSYQVPAYTLMDDLLQQAALPLAQIDWIIPHQASQQAMQHAAKRLSLGPDKVIDIFAQHGNQVAASLPTALDIAVRDGRIQRGQTLMLIGTGAGLSLGGMILEY